MALRDWPLCDAKLVLWSHRPLRGVRITPGSQPLRPSVRTGAPPLSRGGLDAVFPVPTAFPHCGLLPVDTVFPQIAMWIDPFFSTGAVEPLCPTVSGISGLFHTTFPYYCYY